MAADHVNEPVKNRVCCHHYLVHLGAAAAAAAAAACELILKKTAASDFHSVRLHNSKLKLMTNIAFDWKRD